MTTKKNRKKRFHSMNDVLCSKNSEGQNDRQTTKLALFTIHSIKRYLYSEHEPLHLFLLNDSTAIKTLSKVYKEEERKCQVLTNVKRLTLYKLKITRIRMPHFSNA